MARLIYAAILYLAAPLVWLRLLWRSRRQPAYRQHVRERWGYYGKASAGPTIWLHAVSVGETRAAAPLIDALQQRYPDHRILLTCMTPTGRETGTSLYRNKVELAYLPYDYPGATRRFLAHFHPVFGVLMETEIWPNLLAACRRQTCPVFLANARLSERSARGYQRFSVLTGPAFKTLSGVAAQTEEDASRISALGATPVSVCGNVKFDVDVPVAAQKLGQEWRGAIGPRPIWLAASTREGEEAAILDAWQQTAPHSALLVVVPRHPQRFDEVRQLIESRGLRCTRRSAELPDGKTDVWFGDSMGEMFAYYSLADLAFIGGSLLPLGGQNLIEAAACACPVLIGEHTFNFSQATEQAIAAGAATRVSDAADLVAKVQNLLTDDLARAQMKTAGLAFAGAHRGASAKTLAFIVQRLDQAAH